ncbi:PTS system, beta-glucoside IIABC component [Spiroplasma gladiatoris]|uniref:PTS system, beta-glucoside IIABC component n=1 Tax=Spiroplasma gladiatoris TaxID=2143 RepID=A0A4P7AHY3_9MOLU|nr:glucose PTS transporter subunit IIA [Spiroplasma gladiatoris]QBQ07832.1 PTS system, beta-glucoside IIABC component [Spiroplasma gladiatoris]
MEKIQIYAPVEGYVKKIEEISDSAFSSKALGEGVFIEPNSNLIYSPLYESKIELIIDTLHAFYFSSNNVNVLMHIGLETVNLEGKPFKLLKKQGEKILLNEQLINVDWNLIDSKKMSRSTPILVDTSNFKTFKITYKNINKIVKKGELIYEVEYELKEQKPIDNKKVILEKRESKYKTIAYEYLAAIGGRSNQSLCHNCMTRLRFKIINKNLVNEKAIKKIELTKGINWNGEELQIIIGGEVYKVKDECQIIIEDRETNEIKSTKKINKTPVKKKIMGAITAIVFPTVPILIGTGVISGIQAILVISKVIVNPAQGQSIMELDLFSALMYIMSKVGIELVGIVFLSSTVKYFKGDPWLAIWLGIALSSRYLFGNGWTLFTIFDNPITIKTYEGTVLPMICAGILLVFIDKWIKKWMPTSVDIVFRPALVFLIVFVTMLFTVGPLFRIIEQLIAKFVILLGKIPFGLGMGIFAMIWQPLILTGTHVAVIAVITLPMNVGDPSAMYAACQIGIMGQIGAVIAVAILTKNQKTKQAVFAALPGAIFGITEPIVYGVNLPKIKPFLYGCLGGLVGGILAGFLKVEQYRRTGTGIMSYMGLELGWGTAFGVISGLVALVFALLITLLFFKDRKFEHIGYKENNKILLQVLKRNLNLSDSELKNYENELKNKYEVIKKFIPSYKEYEKSLIELQKKELKKQLMINKFENKKEKKYNKAKKYEYKNLDKFNILATKYNKLKLSDKYEIIVQQIKVLEEKNKMSEIIVSEFNKNSLLEINNFINKINVNDNSILKTFYNNYWNSLYSIDISFAIAEPMNIDYSKKEYLNLMSKENLKNAKKNKW